MSQERTYAGSLGDLERLIAALFANAEDLPELEGTRALLEQILDQTRETLQEQAALIARKQDASRRVVRLVGDGQRVATGVRKILRARYGLNAEKLAEFGVQPFRGRKRRAAPKPAGAADEAGSDS
jgi:hypothetical protein